MNVNRRAVAELVPLRRPHWVSCAPVARVLTDAPADPELLGDVARLRAPTVRPR